MRNKIKNLLIHPKPSAAAPSADKRSLIRPNFGWTDFFRSETAEKLRIDNSLEANFKTERERQQILLNLQHTANNAQAIRDYTKIPIIISSAFRCVAVNNAVGGSKNSAHLSGAAIDIYSQRMSLEELFKAVKEMHKKGMILIDQCLIERGCVHVASWREIKKNRGYFGSW